MRFILPVIILVGFSSQVRAGCELSIGPCSTDSSGNRYSTEQGLGGGYTTYKNGSHYSTTDQTLGGTWREKYDSGGSRS